MHDDALARLRAYYGERLARHGETARGVSWQDDALQRLRFDVLLDVGDVEHASVLDFGCGLGHLIDHLRARGFQGEYVGVDALDEMVDRARARVPDARFDVATVDDLQDGRVYDYVVASGVFVLFHEDEMHAAVNALFKRARKALAFNCLSAWAFMHKEGELFVDPFETVRRCRAITPAVALRHDYLPNDFTIYMRKRQLADDAARVTASRQVF